MKTWFQAFASACALLTAAGCDPSGSFDPIVVDISGNCNAVEVRPIVEGLDSIDQGYSKLLAVAHDGVGLAGMWMLVELGTSPERSLSLWHLDDTEIDAQIPIDVPAEQAFRLQLVPAPQQAQAWLVEADVGVFRFWRVDANLPAPVQDVSTNLAGFPLNAQLCDGPGPEPESCDDVSTWWRGLAFLEEGPYIVAAPPLSPDHTIKLYLDRIQGGGLAQKRRRITFERRCPDDTAEVLDRCESDKLDTTTESISVLGTQFDSATASFRMMLAHQTRLGGRATTDLTVSIASLYGDSEAGGSELAVHPLEGATNVTAPPLAVAVDPRNVYGLVSYGAGTLLLELDTRLEPLEVGALTRPGDSLALLQLDQDIALSRLSDGQWELTKLFPDAPEQSQVVVHAASSPILSVSAGGPGVFALHKQDQTTDIVRVVCSAPQTTDP